MANEKGWKKGDKVVSKPGVFLAQQRLTYLADSELDYKCFIAEDAVGDVSDDWKIEEFEKGER